MYTTNASHNLSENLKTGAIHTACTNSASIRTRFFVCYRTPRSPLFTPRPLADVIRKQIRTSAEYSICAKAWCKLEQGKSFMHLKRNEDFVSEIVV